MDSQDWTTVVLKKRGYTSSSSSGPKKATIQERKPNNEGQRLAALEKKIENNETLVQKKLESESKKILIQMRLSKGLTQEQADQLCGMPRNSFRELEAGRRLPSGRDISSIQKQLGVALKLV
jgi:hypothetical protein